MLPPKKQPSGKYRQGKIVEQTFHRAAAILRSPSSILPALLVAAALPGQAAKPPIDRHALVSRHNVVLTQFDGERPLQVGNGEFAFGMDITGLQTFAPFNTMSQWGWHSGPLPAGQRIEDYQGQIVETHGRAIRYPLPDPQHSELSNWLAANPHRLNLGRIGLVLTKKDGRPAAQGDLQNAQQTLDLWNGLVTSRFELEEQPVTVITACHPTLDAVAVRVQSPLVKAGRLSVFLACPGNNPVQFANVVGDWSHPGRFERRLPIKQGRADFDRRIDETVYHVSILWQGSARLHQSEVGTTAVPVLKIVKAEYGAGNRWRDVTEIAAKAVQDGHLTLRVNNTLGEDPAPGVGKILRVVYKSDGIEQTAQARENEELRLDASSSANRISFY